MTIIWRDCKEVMLVDKLAGLVSRYSLFGGFDVGLATELLLGGMFLRFGCLLGSMLEISLLMDLAMVSKQSLRVSWVGMAEEVVSAAKWSVVVIDLGFLAFSRDEDRLVLEGKFASVCDDFSVGVFVIILVFESLLKVLVK